MFLYPVPPKITVKYAEKLVKKTNSLFLTPRNYVSLPKKHYFAPRVTVVTVNS